MSLAIGAIFGGAALVALIAYVVHWVSGLRDERDAQDARADAAEAAAAALRSNAAAVLERAAASDERARRAEQLVAEGQVRENALREELDAYLARHPDDAGDRLDRVLGERPASPGAGAGPAAGGRVPSGSSGS